jgi:hypothetical protein
MDAVRLTIYGKEHEVPGELCARDLAPFSMGLGTSVGIAIKPNEDCLGAAALGSELILAIADGHWGRDASEE